MEDMEAMVETASPDYKYIVNELAPKILARFVSKGSDYGDAYKLLGSKGQFSDINRKFWKLYNSVWCGETLKGEQPAECAEDIIGHCLLLILLLERESTPDRAKISSPERLVPPTLPASGPARLGEDAVRCPAVSTATGKTARCELYRGHGKSHLSGVGTIEQYQWKDVE